MNRAMATVETIESLTPIDGADRIESAKVRGWNVVVQKGLYEPGSRVIYCEIDSFLPADNPAFGSFMERGTRTDAAGNIGHVVKTIRLRGQYSQGLCMPVEQFPEILDHFTYDVLDPYGSLIGKDVSEIIGVTKWEPPLPASMRGEIRGQRPGWIWKTDAERIQNFEEFLPLNPKEYYCTEKIDGSSASYSLNGDDFHVCSRNMDLKETEGNLYWEIVKKYQIREFLEDMLGEQTIGKMDGVITLQGEVYGEGVNGNRLGLKGHHFAAFNFELNGRVVPLIFLGDSLIEGIEAVPLLDIPAPQSASEALEAVDGMKSTISPDRLAEGVVWRRVDGEDIIPGIRAVKAISNKYLLKEK